MSSGFRLMSAKEYKLHKRQYPNCTCTYDDYGDALHQHADCPDHGEVRGVFKSQCGCRWVSKADADAGKAAAVPCNVHRPKPTVEQTRDMLKATVHEYEPPPAHYATNAGIDPWAVWDAFDLDRYTANAVKYLLRAGKKDIAPRLDDLRKARNYINKAIEMEEKREADQGS